LARGWRDALNRRTIDFIAVLVIAALLIIHIEKNSMAKRSIASASKELSLSDFAKLSPSENELDAVWSEIDRQSHRAAAVLGGAMVEDALQFAIQAHFVMLSKTDKKKLFEYPAPLSSFDAKIRIGYAVGLYGPVVRNDLNLIRRVRNGFAHAKKPISFETLQVVREIEKVKYLAQLPDHLKVYVDRLNLQYDSAHRTTYAQLARMLAHQLFMLAHPLGKRAKKRSDLP
jgi:hypothetical protein